MRQPFLCKIIVVSLSLTCYSFSARSQAPPIYWQKSYGGNKADGRAILRTTSDNGFIVGGFGNSTDGDFAGINSGGMDMHMLKLDACGNKLWSKKFGSGGNDLIYGLVESADHGYLFTGTTFSFVSPSYHGGIQDAILCKTDAAGNIQWTKLLGGTKEDLLDIIIPLPDTSYIIAGWTNSPDGDGMAIHGNTDAWVVHLDKNGNVLWTKTFGGAAGDAFFDITPSADGGFVAAGHTNLNGVVSDLYVVKMDANGNMIWQKTYGGLDADFGRTVRKAAGGGYIVAGSTSSTNGNVSGQHGNLDGWVVRLNESGNLLWQKCIGGTQNESIWEMTVLPGDQYLFGGTTTSNDGDISNNQGLNDALAFCLDGNGNVVWLKTYGGTASEEFFSVVVTAEGDPILTGQSSSNNGDISGNHGQTDFVLFKLKKEPSIQKDTTDITSCEPIIVNDILFTHDTSFTVVLKDRCDYDSATVHYIITITPAAQIQSIDDISIMAGDPVVLTTTSSGPVQWKGPGLNCYTCLSPVAHPMVDSRYIVTTGIGSCMASDTIYIYVSSPNDTLFIPTAFTPDDNGRNDIFKAIGFATDFTMKIFNRWGEQIFQSQSLSQGWNGIYKGQRQPTGVYVYMIRYKTASGRSKQVNGTMTLVR